MSNDARQAAATLQVLTERFGFTGFKPGQDEVVAAVLDGRDCLAVLPTGAGKSLCYQLPALLRPGVTLVVSPLIALMKDQVDALVARGLPATFLNSSLTPGEMSARLARVAAGQVRLVYVAPERFRSERFVQAIAAAQVGLFAVDEAHCISMWGHDFRPDYQRLGEAMERLGRPQVLAVTATATEAVRRDILVQLGLSDSGARATAVLVRGFARPELTLAVSRPGGAEDKFKRLNEVLREHPTGIVYCATRAAVEKLGERLDAPRRRCAVYHAGLPDEARRRAQEAFISGEVPVVVATNAFGMGIDRADLRFVVHWDVPGSLEGYYQEAGRAGRDGAPARCELLFNHADVRTQQFFLEGANPPADLVRRVRDALVEAASAGPLAASDAEVGDLAGGVRNLMSVGTTIGLLERSGVLHRCHGPEGRTIVLDSPLASLDPVLEALPRKAALDRARLSAILGYANERGCRHAAVLRYFGDPAPVVGCTACDNCRRTVDGASSRPHRAVTSREGASLNTVLAFVDRVRGRFGRARVAQALAGSRDRAVLAAGLDRVAGYGELRGLGVAGVRRLVDGLVDDDCLETAGTEYPTVRLTDRGRKVLDGSEQPTLPAAAPRGAGDFASSAGTNDVPVSATVIEAATEALKALRRRLAAARGVPAYCILHDATIAAIARSRPTTLDELGGIKGMGGTRLASLGAEILRAVARSGS